MDPSPHALAADGAALGSPLSVRASQPLTLKALAATDRELQQFLADTLRRTVRPVSALLSSLSVS